MGESAGGGGPSRKAAAAEPSGASTSGNTGDAAQPGEPSSTATLSNALPTTHTAALSASANVVTAEAAGGGGSSKANVRQRKERQQQRKAAEAATASAQEHMSSLAVEEPVCARRGRIDYSPVNLMVSCSATHPTEGSVGLGGAGGQQQQRQCERGWLLVAGSPAAHGGGGGGGEQAVRGVPGRAQGPCYRAVWAPVFVRGVQCEGDGDEACTVPGVPRALRGDDEDLPVANLSCVATQATHTTA
jgi:hypothetical protein